MRKRRLCLFISVWVSAFTLMSCHNIQRYWKSLKAETAYNQGNMDKAVVLYKELLEKNPSDANLQWKLGTVYYSKGDLLNVRRQVLKLENMERHDLAKDLRELMAK